MGGACGTYGREESYIQGYGGERYRKNLQNLGVDGSIILEWILKKSVERADRNT